MSTPVVLPANVPLPEIPDGITVVSFNVLLPNGKDGWWMYKSYQPHVPEEHRAWPYRKALMRKYLLSKDADVVCVQEASAETFDSDFDFMKDAGYGCVLHSKFRFRSATFFKTSKLELMCEKHKDRVLVTGLRTLPKGPEDSATPPTPPPPPQSDAVAATGAAAVAQANPDRGGAGGSAGVSSSSENGPIATPTGTGRLFMVINCHLTGGGAPERRMRQVLDGLDTARKEASKLISAEAAAAAAEGGKSKGSEKGGGGAEGREGRKGGKGGGGAASAPAPGTSAPVVVCGDFNSNGRTAVWELLTKGVVEASFREQGYPDTAITSKDKRHGFGPFADLYEEAYGAGEGSEGGSMLERGDPLAAHPPPTFLVPLLHPHFIGEDGEGISSRLKAALSKAFYSFVARYGTNTANTDTEEATSGDRQKEKTFLPREGVEAWLVKINRALGRGSEFRAAEAIMEPGPEGGLTLEDFFSIYAMEVREGKFWGVAHDLHALGVELPGGIPWVGPYTARFDRVFYSKATLDAVGAMEPLCQEDRELVAGGDCLPNSWHPSDHLAVAGAFRFK
eukprot:g12623.t1